MGDENTPLVQELLAERRQLKDEVEILQRSAEGWETTALLAERNKADRESEVKGLTDSLRRIGRMSALRAFFDDAPSIARVALAEEEA